jgi:hypothetical protein
MAGSNVGTPGTPVPVPSGGGPKFPKPQTYSGERSKLRSFLTQMDMHIAINSAFLATEDAKVVYVSTCLRDAAFDWIEPSLREYYNESQSEWSAYTKEIFKSYKDFKKRFTAAFGDIDAVRSAERQLRALRQTGSAQQLAAKFKQIIAPLDWDDEVYIGLFENMLKVEVQMELIKVDRPKNIDRFIEMAVKYDNKLYEMKLKQKEIQRWRQFGGTPRKANQGQKRQDPYGPQPMELDATQERQDNRKKFDKSNVECYNCGKKGHFKRECRSPKKEEKQLKATQERQLKATSEYEEGHNSETMSADGYDEPVYEDPPLEEERPLCESFSGTESEMDRHLETMHAWELYEEQDAQRVEVPETPEEISTDDELDKPRECGWDCEYKFSNVDHPGHREMVWTACTVNACLTHQSSKNDAGWFPSMKVTMSPESCNWMRHEAKRKEVLRQFQGWAEKGKATPDRRFNLRQAVQSAGTEGSASQKPDMESASEEEEEEEEEEETPKEKAIKERIRQTNQRRDIWKLIAFKRTSPQYDEVYRLLQKRIKNGKPEELEYHTDAMMRWIKDIQQQKQALEERDKWPEQKNQACVNSFRRILQEWTTLSEEEIEKEAQDWEEDVRLRQQELERELKATAHGKHFKVIVNISGTDFHAMIDSGATGNYMDPRAQKRLGIPGQKKEQPVPLTGLNGEKLAERGITDESGYVDMEIGAHHERINFDITRLGRDDIILGSPWLRKHNPEIHWENEQLILTRCNCGTRTLKATGIGSVRPVITIQEGKVRTPLQDGVTKENVTITEVAEEERQLASSTEVVLPEEYERFKDLFDGTYKSLPEHSEWDHTIPLMEGKEPKPQKIYQLSELETRALKKYIDDMLEKGYIRPSSSPAGYPVLFVPKKGTTELRPCIDYRQLNNITIKDAYPLPLINEIQDKVKGKKWFTKLDITDAYNRLRIKEGEEWKTAFRTKFGHFEYLVMPFGLTNAPAAFQRYVNSVIKDYLYDFVIAYLDDIIIFSDSKEDHIRHVKLVLRNLRMAKLQVKLRKCEFHVQETDFLGHRITQEGIETDKTKVQAIRDWPQPKNVKELQSFIGMINYYRRYIQGYASIMVPLFKLLKKDIDYEWGPEQEKAFKQAKHYLTTAPILAQFDYEKPTTLETDASDFAIGATMTQEGPDGKRRVIAYYSRKMIDAELNYDIHDKELLAIVTALQQWRVYLEGAKFPIRIITDHKNLTYFQTTKVLTRRQARWSEILSQYWFTIEHCKGKDNERADALSRRPDHEEGVRKPEPALLRQNKEGNLEYNP